MTLNETSNSIIAGAAVVSPIWLPMIEEVGKIAGFVLPVLGCVYLVLQIIYLIWKK